MSQYKHPNICVSQSSHSLNDALGYQAVNMLDILTWGSMEVMRCWRHTPVVTTGTAACASPAPASVSSLFLAAVVVVVSVHPEDGGMNQGKAYRSSINILQEP